MLGPFFPIGQQHVDNTSTGSATGSGTEWKQQVLGRTSRASLQFTYHFVGIDAREQRHGTQFFAEVFEGEAQKGLYVYVFSNWLRDRFGFALRAGHFFPFGQQHVDKLNDRPCFR